MASRKRTKPPTVVVGGYKSIREETRLPLNHLTLLSGRNSSGKSSIMQPWLLLKQTSESPYDQSTLRLDGPHVRFTESGQAFSHGKRKADSASVIRIGIEGAANTTLSFCQSKAGIAISEQEVHVGKSTFNLTLETTDKQLKRLVQTTGFIPKAFAKERLSLIRSGYQFGLAVELPDKRKLQISLWGGSGQIETTVLNILHVPGLRGNPERLYAAHPVGTTYPGHFHPYTAGILVRWHDKRDSRLAQLNDQLRSLGLTWKVLPRRLDDTRVELTVGRQAMPRRGGARDVVNIADVGFGVSQTLPVLVALLAAEPGQIAYVEQPEIHLHPMAQVALADCMADAAERGVIVVAETHSALLLRAIQRRVAEGELDEELVSLHWFTRDAEGFSKITTAELDSQGAFGDWPEDFAATDMDLEEAYIRAVMDS